MELLFYNGFGGFDVRKGEYVIDSVQPTPMPWVNCITCVSGIPFGFLISDAGGGFVWSGNSHSGRLTPWLCQTVQDPVNERIFITQEDGSVWDCIARIRKEGDRVRFGKGYAVFERPAIGCHRQISTSLTVYAGARRRVKCSVLTVTSKQDEEIRISYEVRVDGFLPDRLPCKVHPYGCILKDRVYIRCSLSPDRVNWKGDCITLSLPLRLKADTPVQICFYFGDDDCLEQEGFLPEISLEEVRQNWEEILGKIRIATPEPAFDVLVNGWLLYQVKSCRLDGRSGYYQSGGAYGFRDQLQDALALLYTAPERVRTQILLHASRQYEEGDVQHWWHPPGGAGVRTHCSDDLLWLIYCTSEYIRCTQDVNILHEPVSFIRSKPLSAEERDRYEVPEEGERKPLGEHLTRALERGIRLGKHGLPLIGSCDWNDGLSEVGTQGVGESVWLSWFLQDVIGRYIELSEIFAPEAAAVRRKFREVGASLKSATEQYAWDGDRYLRAYCDDGKILGSHTSPECSIDSIAQSWACISGFGDAERVKLSLDTAVKYLADFDNGVIRLLAPSFSKMQSVGYIASYPPGIRENGGQYTHAAVWLAKALFRIGETSLGYNVLKAINPVSHTCSKMDVCRYRAEPYVVCADVYSGACGNVQNGRGGWSWYTGSASWMYRVILEDFLGFRLFVRNGETVVSFHPNLPSSWKSFALTYRHGTASYIFTVESGAKFEMTLADDGQEHRMVIRA